MPLPGHVSIREVALRDGLQIEQPIPLSAKLELLAAIAATGVHANDWQAGLIPVYLETLYRDTPAYADVATVFTVHNLAYQGIFWHYDLPMTGLGWDLFTPAGPRILRPPVLLKGGLVFADQLTTVSPTYAREIQGPECGERLDGVLRERSGDLRGS